MITLGGFSGWIDNVGHFGSFVRDFKKNEFYEHTFLKYIEQLGRKGVYMDVGACIGTHSVFMARFCDSTEVLAYEPKQDFCKVIKKNCKLNGVQKKVKIRPYFVSDEPGNDRQTIALDTDFVDAISVMKIDVEGCELSVLKSARKILSDARPVVFCECMHGEDFEKVNELLGEFGYYHTGRTFNHTPMYEFFPNEGLGGNGAEPVEISLIESVPQVDGKVKILPRGYSYIKPTINISDFLKETLITTDVHISEYMFLFSVEAILQDNQDISIRWQFYNKKEMLAESIYSMQKGRLQEIKVPADTTDVIPVIRISGQGDVEIRNFSLFVLPKE